VPYRQITWLTGLFVAAAIGSTPAKADACATFTSSGPTCFYSNDVVYVYFGSLTLLAPDGSFLSTTNLETASTGVAPDFFSTTTSLPTPAAFLSLFPGLVSQLQSDPQSGFAGFQPWFFTDLTNLENAHGFGENTDNNPFPDPATTDYNSQLANVGGPYATISDTGFQQLPFSQADCDYINSMIPGACTPPAPGQTGNDYVFTYVLGPDPIGGNTFTSFVNFQILTRDVTEQLVATPEPSSLVLLGGVAIAIVLLSRRRSNAVS
jgi:hypothetical protein